MQSLFMVAPLNLCFLRFYFAQLFAVIEESATKELLKLSEYAIRYCYCCIDFVSLRLQHRCEV